jgi:uridine kinase
LGFLHYFKGRGIFLMFLVGIAGGSGSGKTTFAKKILHRVPQENGGHVALIHQDSYYLASPPAHLRVHGESNFDHPDAFDWELMKDHLQKLKRGESVETPVYDYKTSQRTSETETVGPCKTILLEGIYTLWDAEIRNLFDLKVYLNVEADIRFIRRLHRDVRERGRGLDNIIRQYYDTVRPMHHEFLEPTRQFADLIVGEETDVPADVVAARVNEVVSSLRSSL